MGRKRKNEGIGKGNQHEEMEIEIEIPSAKTVDKERGINRSLISKEFIRVFLSEIVDLEGEAVNKKYE